MKQTRRGVKLSNGHTGLPRGLELHEKALGFHLKLRSLHGTKSAFSKTWQQLTSKTWSSPEVLAAAVARVNIKPTAAFCAISREISLWPSTATGNNSSQLRQPVATLDIPVASGPMLSVEMRKSPARCCPLSWGQSSQAPT